ncbi:hypothetical protein MMP73_04600 [Acinetobacter sp. NIPH 605]|nr:hypothetical protein [Acinetobacter higginsii]MCH7338841.1 hypothetical protein [Acinetobacter higginsii]
MKMMKMPQQFRSLLFLFGLLITLSACSQQSFLEKIVPPQEKAFAEDMFNQLSNKNYAAIEKYLSPELQDESTHSTLIQMAGLFPAEPVKNIKLIAANKSLFKDVVTYQLSFEYEFADHWLINKIVLSKQADQIRIIGIHVEPIDHSVQAMHGFTFAGKSLLHYVVFILAITIPLFCIYAFILCIRTPMQKRKWLWLIFICFGFMQFSLNWTDGSYAFQMLSFLVLGAGYFQQTVYSPIILQIALPLGAILFVYRRKSLMAEQ